MAIHRHLLDAHLEMVETRIDEEDGKMYYLVPCPFCGLKYRHRVKPRRRDPVFLKEFKAEIAMVAFDQLLYHVLQKHAAAVGVDPDELEFDPNEAA
ncbi:MAG: hypothetical protein ACE5FD_00120 [Anaerolineae bacterium]